MHIEKKILKAINLLMIGALIFVSNYGFVADTEAAEVSREYIVVFKDSVKDSTAASNDIARKHGVALGHTYFRAIRGFSGIIPPVKLEKIKKDPRVAYVSEDKTVYPLSHSGLLDANPPNQIFPNNILRVGGYAPLHTGKGVTVAVLDSGTDATHPDLVGQVAVQKNCMTGRKNSPVIDNDGHGTRVAGIIAALNNDIGVVGLAPEARIAGVKVWDTFGTGRTSYVICGLEWAIKNAAQYNIKVINMSLYTLGYSDNSCGSLNRDALHKAVCAARDAGLTVVTASGNSLSSVDELVPGSYNDAVITVSYLTDSDGQPGGFGLPTEYGYDDQFARNSNYGDKIDVAAPGFVLSTYPHGEYVWGIGSSFSAAHAAGAAALYLEGHPGARWEEVKNALVNRGEPLNGGHTDPTGLHREPVLQVHSLYDALSYVRVGRVSTHLLFPQCEYTGLYGRKSCLP
jgi:subtilisin family serine protease